MSSDVRFVEDFFPLLISIGPSGGFDEHQIELMSAYYRGLWKRGERYALISHSPKSAESTNARGRKLIVEWARTPEVRAMSAKYCVGSTTVVPNAMARGALTAILWVWSPSSPHEACATAEEALDWCLRRLAEENIPLPYGEGVIRRRVLAMLRE